MNFTTRFEFKIENLKNKRKKKEKVNLHVLVGMYSTAQPV
jgi:hypothetical protein